MRKRDMHNVAATTLLEELSHDDVSSIEKLGLNSEIIAALVSLDTKEKIELVKQASKYLKLSIDVDALAKQINRVEGLRDERELENYFLIKYAPYRLMNSLFGMHATEFSQRRKRLGIDGKSGRPNIGDEKTDAAVWTLWKKLEELEVRERYIKVSELSNQNIDTIWTVLQRYEFGIQDVG
jgi:hypothetical protein